MKSKIFTKIIASAMSVMMIFSMSGVSVKAAQLQENNELKTVMVDMKDVATGDAIVYASTSTSTKTLSKDYATSTGQTGAITSIGQNVDFSSIIPQGSVIESITIYCPTGTRVTQSKYTTINNYLISSYETGTTATVSFKQTNSPSSTSKTTAFSGEAANVKFLVKIQGKIIQQYTGMRWNLSRGFSAKHNVSENSVQNICRAVSPQRMRIIGSMVFFYL